MASFLWSAVACYPATKIGIMSRYSANNNVHLYLILLLKSWLPAGDACCPGWVTRSNRQAAEVSAGGSWRVCIHHASKGTAPKTLHVDFLERFWGGNHHPRRLSTMQCTGRRWEAQRQGSSPQPDASCLFAWIKYKRGFLELPVPRWEVKLLALGSPLEPMAKSSLQADLWRERGDETFLRSYPPA